MQPGHPSGSAPMWWWKVAMHLDEAQLALANAMAHNVDDPRPGQELYDRLRDGQAILLTIFRAKGLLPGSTNGKTEVPMPLPPAGAVSPPAAETAPTSDTAPSRPLAADEPAVPDADHAAASEPAQPEPELDQPSAPAPDAAAAEANQTELPPAGGVAG